MAPSPSEDPYQCLQSFTFECHAPNCCASYHQRFMMLLFAIGVFVFAILVGFIWMAVDFRPSKYRAAVSRYQNKRRSTVAETTEVQVRSIEETKYLRRMSEINPLARHSQYV
uniref:Uncharacterized protein n=1 Tax=Panagrellus redivivus TaxID=6233 RepID=A0A7E4VY65_PANRE